VKTAVQRDRLNKLVSLKSPEEQTSRNSRINLVFGAHGPQTGSVSGGAVRELEIMKRLGKDRNVVLRVFSSEEICRKFQNNGIKAYYRCDPSFVKGGKLFAKIFDSILRSIFVCISSVSLGDNALIYSPSDFIWDTLPAFVWKLRNKKAKCLICIFLIVPNLFRDYSRNFDKNNRLSFPTSRRLFYFLSQQLTISLAKRQADQILVLNKVDKEYLVTINGVDPSKVSVVNGGVDYSHIIKLEKPGNLYDGVFLGRFHPQKGIFDLIQIWRLVCDKRPDAKLCIIGSGEVSFTEKLKELIKKNNLSGNVTLVGSKTGDEKFFLLKASSLFLCPSYYESFAIVIAEAMACGLPVVAYKLPIYKEIYGEKISEVPLGDLNQFVTIILSFLDNADLRRISGLNAQKYVQRYDWTEIAEIEYRIMGKVVGSSK
jgi:glycosyltransferase involved in cell wall biosynthesis